MNSEKKKKRNDCFFFCVFNTEIKWSLMNSKLIFFLIKQLQTMFSIKYSRSRGENILQMRRPKTRENTLRAGKQLVGVASSSIGKFG
jgi:hypothetical protein